MVGTRGSSGRDKEAAPHYVALPKAITDQWCEMYKNTGTFSLAQLNNNGREQQKVEQQRTFARRIYVDYSI